MNTDINIDTNLKKSKLHQFFALKYFSFFQSFILVMILQKKLTRTKNLHIFHKNGMK